MARIYVSSTYVDLKSERQAVINAIRMLGHTVVSMEDYHAKDDRPLDLCRNDVRTCQGLISIVAFRYGFTPESFQESITELEFLTASEPAMRGKTKRLAFLLRENVPSWPPEFVDFNRSKVTEFRKKLRTELTIEEFSSIPDLADSVRRAVKREFGELPSRFGLLPFLIDRTQQLRAVDSELESRKRDTAKRPFFFLVQGDDIQCPDKFVDVALLEKVAPFADVSPEELPVKEIFVPWPVDAADVPGEFLKALGEKLTIRGASRDQVRDALQNHPCILAIRSRILTSDWTKGRTEAQIEAFRKLWSEWKDLLSRRPIIIFLELKYESRDTSLLSMFSSSSRLNKHIRNFLAPLAKGGSPPSESGIAFRVLDELSPVRRSDVENWVDENEEVKQICGGHDPRPHIQKMFASAEARKYEGRLPLRTVSSELQKLLSNGCVCMDH